MPAYILVEIEIHNPELYEEYKQLTPASISEYQGRFIVRGGKTKILEGSYENKRRVILEFPSFQIAASWWCSEDYTKARKIREKAATTNMILLEGVLPIKETLIPE